MAWSLVDKSLMLQSILYVVVVITAMATSISITMSRNSFHGVCSLYAHASCEPLALTTHNDTIDLRLKRENRKENENQLSTFMAITNTPSSITAPPLKPPTTPPLTPPLIPLSTTKPTTKPPTSTTTTATNALKGLVLKAGASSVCDFIIGSNVLISIFYACAMATYHAHCAKKSAYQIRVGFQMWTKVLLFASCLCLLLTMASASMATVGLSKWCRSVAEAFYSCSQPFNGCSDSETQTWSLNGAHIHNPIRHLDLTHVTEASNWFNVFFWLLHVAFYLHRLFRQRNISTSYQEPFTNDFLDAFS